MLLSDFQIGIRLIFLVMLLRLVAFTFVTCLMKFLSWLVGSSLALLNVFANASLFCCVN